jgi:transposase
MINKREVRKYDDEFKKEALALVKTSNKSAAEVADDLGINVNNIYYWLKKEGKISNSKAISPDESQEMKRLKRELEDVKLERDILKKAVAIFSKQPR